VGQGELKIIGEHTTKDESADLCDTQVSGTWKMGRKMHRGQKTHRQSGGHVEDIEGRRSIFLGDKHMWRVLPGSCFLGGPGGLGVDSEYHWRTPASFSGDKPTQRVLRGSCLPGGPGGRGCRFRGHVEDPARFLGDETGREVLRASRSAGGPGGRGRRAGGLSEDRSRIQRTKKDPNKSREDK